MVSIQEALASIYTNVHSSDESLEVSLDTAFGCILFQDVRSPISMPPFRQSAMDGYAINLHADTSSYVLVDEIKAGDTKNPILQVGEAVRIFTGAAVPHSANAVVIQEKVEIKGNRIHIEESIQKEEHIRPKGEQVQKGSVALMKGVRLTAAAIGYLNSLGITHVSIYKKPSIAIITTGNELIPPGQELDYGKIYESNSEMLRSALLNCGYEDVAIHKVEDEFNETVSQLDSVISTNDLVLITGGISVGDYDFVGKALKELKVKELFYKVKQKPGKPLFFGQKDKTTVFALPGNPAAALSCFYIYVQTALKCLTGATDYLLEKVEVKSGSHFIKKGDRPQFLKALFKNGKAKILEGQSSAMLQTFALANCLVFVPEDLTEINVDDMIEVILFNN